MPTFVPQLGDIDHDGRVDLISGSNCCAPKQFHWFPGKRDGGFSELKSAVMVFAGEPSLKVDKSESRPYLIDWDRDGRDDIVVVLEVIGSDSNRVGYRIFVNTHRQLPRDEQAGMEWHFRGFDFGSNDPMSQLDRDLRTHERRTNIHFAFADYDQDGHFDALFCETAYRIELQADDEGSYRRNKKIRSGVYLMKNLAAAGAPVFSAPKKIFDAPANWGFTSIAVTDIQNNGTLNIVTGVTRENATDPRVQEAELWLLSR